MTTPKTHTLAVSSAPTPAFEPVIGRPEVGHEAVSAPQKAQVFHIAAYATPEEPAPAGHMALDDLVRNWSRDESRRKAIEDARRWAADSLASEAGETIRTLRLRRGLSQARLAEMIGTSQPHIARIERGTENVTIDTCRRLAAALEVDMNTLDQALRRQEAAGKGAVPT